MPPYEKSQLFHVHTKTWYHIMATLLQNSQRLRWHGANITVLKSMIKHCQQIINATLHCLGLGHETMVYAVCLSIFFCNTITFFLTVLRGNTHTTPCMYITIFCRQIRISKAVIFSTCIIWKCRENVFKKSDCHTNSNSNSNSNSKYFYWT